MLIALNPVWEVYWLIDFANEDMSDASIVAEIDTASEFFPCNPKLIFPLIPDLKGPRIARVLALTLTPVPDRSVLSFDAIYWADEPTGMVEEEEVLLSLVIFKV